MLQLKNTSPFAPQIVVFPDKDGIDTLYVVIRGAFRIGERLDLAEQQMPPVREDEYWGKPGLSSLKYASDMHIGKPTTDVVLVGHAWAPEGRRVEQIDVSLSVAGRRKPLRVSGDRRWRGGLRGGFTPPEPFESVPIVYERAYGGLHVVDAEKGKVLGEERNPVGVGFRGKRAKGDFADELLPNVEDPRRLVTSPGAESDPAGFGYIAPSWLPRRNFAGTYDEAWQSKRAPYLPDDFDPRFCNAAHPDLVFDRYLEGGEPVEATGVSRRGPLRFPLPACDLDVKVKIAGRTEAPKTSLETVLLEPDEDRLSLIWRASVRCDKEVLKIEEVAVAVKRLDLGEE